MASHPRLRDVLMRISDFEKALVLGEAGVPDHPPLEEGATAARRKATEELIESHRTILVPALLRVVDLNDDDVAALVAEGSFEVQPPTGHPVTIAFHPETASDAPPSAGSPHQVRLDHLAATTPLLMQLFVDVVAAHQPLRVTLDSVPVPMVEASQGSIRYTIGGGMFASGISLIVACTAGVVAAPVVGPIAGAALATVGAVDLAIGWREKIWSGNKDRETARSSEEERRRQNELHQLELEAKRQEVALLKHKVEASQKRLNERSAAASGLIPKATVRKAAEQVGWNEAQANHVLNRTIPRYVAARSRLVGFQTKVLGAAAGHRATMGA